MHLSAIVQVIESLFHLLQMILHSLCCFQLLVTTNESPVIGILAQETWNDGLAPNNSVIVASYVKFLGMFKN